MSSLTRPTSLDSRRRRVVLAVAVATLLPLGVLPAAAATAPTASPAAASGPQRSSPQQTPPALQAAIVRTKLTAADGHPDDYFGEAVAVDGATAVVGTPDDGIDIGSAYVFVRFGATWVETAKLTAFDGANGDQFGWSVAVEGDMIVIGAPEATNPRGHKAGAAYVFLRSGSTWVEKARLIASDGAGQDQFGWSVAVDGGTTVIGAPTVSSPGAAYVFVRAGTTWTQQAELKASERDGGSFGRSVAVDGATAVVGCWERCTSEGSGGAAYVFVRAGTTWTQQAKLASEYTAGDCFGYSVAVDGDTAAIGADCERNYVGSAYVFVRAGTAWTQQAKLTASDGGAFQAFGSSVAMSGRILVIGARSGGAAYVFVRSGTTWNQGAKLTAADEAPGDLFGHSVALDGDTVIVGAPLGDAPRADDTGAAYVFGL